MCRRPKKSVFFLGLGRFWTFCPLRDLSPLQGPLRDRLTGRPLTGRLLTGRLGPYRKPLTRRGRSLTGRGRGSRTGPFTEKDDEEGLRGSYGEGDFTRIGAGIFRLCAVDQKRLPFMGTFPLTGALYGKPLTGGSTVLTGMGPLTGRVAPFTKKDDEEAYGKAGAPHGKLFTGRGRGSLTGSFTEKDDEEAYGEGREAPYGEETVPYGKGRGPLREGAGVIYGATALRGRPSYEKAPYELQESLREATGEGLYQNWAGNFRLCGRRPKKGRFFPRAGPFLDLLPFKGTFLPYRGPLTGTRPYGKGPLTGRLLTGRLGPLQEAPYEEGRFLREGPGSPYRSFTEKDDEEGPLREGPPYGEASYWKAAPLTRSPLTRRGRSLTGRAGVPYGSFTEKDDEEAYGKGRALTGSPLRGGTVLTRRAGPLWKGRGPLRVLHREGRRRGLREGRALTGNPLGPYGQTDLRKGLLRGGFLQEGPLRGGFLQEGP